MKKQVLFVFGVLAVAGLAVAQAPEGRGRMQRGPRGPNGRLDPAMVKQELGLNEQQVGELQKLRMEQRKAAIRRRADTQLARLGLRELMQAPTVDEKALQAKVKELADLHAAGIRARVDMGLALRKILTPEQQQKMKQLLMERGRRGPGDDGPGRFQRGPRGRRPGPPPGDDEDDDSGPLTRPDGQ